MFKYEVSKGHLINVKYDTIGDFDCSNKNLKTLEGCPRAVNFYFDCSGNKFKTLEGCPIIVNGAFLCNHNRFLKDISNLPFEVSKILIAGCHKIKVFPKHIKDTLTFCYMSEKVYKRLLKQSHLEIINIEQVEMGCYNITVKERPLGEYLLTIV